MRFLVTGASGFIGSALIDKWITDDSCDEIIALSRTPEKLESRFNGRVRVIHSLGQINDQDKIDAVINLAGEPILDKRWSEDRKEKLYDSRINTTDELLKCCRRLVSPPGTLISGSAIGYYGNQKDDRELDEKQEGHPCFAHRLCHDWENKAQQAESMGMRVCLLRTGVVLGRGGVLQRMLPLFRCGLGGPIGSGKQWMSWIDLQDMVNGIDFLLRHETLSGPFNLTAPEPVNNLQFSTTLAQTLRRPAFIRVPAFMLELMLGEGSELLTEGQRVVPEKLQRAGFEFIYPSLKQSLEHVLKAV
ncbi:MAG: TIGR01777 family oxidoreductase [Motiliproteus sp.]